MEFVECVDKSAQRCRLFFGAQPERLHGMSHDAWRRYLAFFRETL